MEIAIAMTRRLFRSWVILGCHKGSMSNLMSVSLGDQEMAIRGGVRSNDTRLTGFLVGHVVQPR